MMRKTLRQDELRVSRPSLSALIDREIGITYTLIASGRAVPNGCPRRSRREGHPTTARSPAIGRAQIICRSLRAKSITVRRTSQTG